MDFAMAMKYIEEKNKLGSVPGLDNVKELLLRLGNPQDSCKCLQIAGTNGKGSVFSFVQEILIDAGYSVGRYISPTIFTYLERFQINKNYISEEAFSKILTEVSDKVSEMEKDGLESPTAFEIETAVAFMYFKYNKVDYALIECGMGGDLDATNVISKPVMSVIASISMDHMQFLGNTLTEIATHKAGIIKNNSVCVMAPQPDEVIEVFDKVCRNMHTELVCVDETAINIQDMTTEKTVFIYDGETYNIRLLGEHQVINATLAIEAARRISGITINNIRAGLEKTTWRGRLTHVCDMPDVYVDGAHNEAAWKYLKKAINKYFTKRKIIYIMGVLRDKEYHKMIDILADTMSYAITVTPDTPRGLEKEILASLISDKGVGTITADSAYAAIEAAKLKEKELYNMDDEKPVILVCGSLSVISEYLLDDWK